MDIDLEHNLKFSHCLYKYVSVTTLDKQVHEGWLKAIDPVSGSLILITLTDDSSEVNHVILITIDTFDDVKVLKEVDPNIKSMLLNLYAGDKSHLAIDVGDRRELLVAWIKRNRLPIRETDNGRALVISESVTIYPPYTADSCNGSNGRVLMLIRNLVDKLPLAKSQSDDAEKKDEQVA